DSDGIDILRQGRALGPKPRRVPGARTDWHSPCNYHLPAWQPRLCQRGTGGGFGGWAAGLKTGGPFFFLPCSCPPFRFIPRAPPAALMHSAEPTALPPFSSRARPALSVIDRRSESEVPSRGPGHEPQPRMQQGFWRAATARERSLCPPL